MNEVSPKAQKGFLPDIERTPMRRDGTRETANFNKNMRSNISALDSPLSKKVFIAPLVESEKVGNRWQPGQRSKSMMANY